MEPLQQRRRPNPSRRNHLLKVIEAQEIALTHKAKGATYRWIWRNHIYDRYRVTYNTFILWLGLPAKRELRDIEEYETTNSTSNESAD